MMLFYTFVFVKQCHSYLKYVKLNGLHLNSYTSSYIIYFVYFIAVVAIILIEVTLISQLHFYI